MVLCRLGKRRFCLSSMMEGALRKLAAINAVDISSAGNKAEIIATLESHGISKTSRPRKKVAREDTKIDIKLMNETLNAPNVIEVDLDLAIMDEIKMQYEAHVKPNLKLPKIDTKSNQSFSVRHFYGPQTDLKWVAVSNMESYSQYLPYFYKLGLEDTFKELIQVDEKIAVYSIFFVVRSYCKRYSFHQDFIDGTGVNAWTLMTPLYDMNTITNGIHLAYKDITGKRQTYQYKRGKAIIFGEGFEHSTDVGYKASITQQPFFCCTFGTDKDRFLPLIFQNHWYGNHVYHPKLGWVESGEL